jgi:dihydrofolate reductase
MERDEHTADRGRSRGAGGRSGSCGAFFMVILPRRDRARGDASIGADLGFLDRGLQSVISGPALNFAGLLLLEGRRPARGVRWTIGEFAVRGGRGVTSETKGGTEMGKIIVSDNVSLDGVIQDPAGDEGFRVGGWVGLIKDRPELGKLALDENLAAEALLLGRRSYEWLAARWPSRSGQLADRLNSLPKYVVSSTLEEPDWNNSTVLKGDVVDEVSKLKHELDGEIVVPASFQLVRTLMEHDLVDELRLKVFPVVLGDGARLFGETSDKKPLRLLYSGTVEGDVAFLTYELIRDA